MFILVERIRGRLQKVELSSQKSIFKYLKKQLTNNNGFKEFGPNSLIFESEIDKIIVYINSCNLIIIHDGPYVNHGMEMIQVFELTELEEDEMNAMYLQPILYRF